MAVTDILPLLPHLNRMFDCMFDEKNDEENDELFLYRSDKENLTINGEQKRFYYDKFNWKGRIIYIYSRLVLFNGLKNPQDLKNLTLDIWIEGFRWFMKNTSKEDNVFIYGVNKL